MEVVLAMVVHLMSMMFMYTVITPDIAKNYLELTRGTEYRDIIKKIKLKNMFGVYGIIRFVCLFLAAFVDTRAAIGLGLCATVMHLSITDSIIKDTIRINIEMKE